LQTFPYTTPSKDKLRKDKSWSGIEGPESLTFLQKGMPRYARPWLAGEIEDFEKKGKANQSILISLITGRNLLSFSSWRAEKAFSLFPPTIPRFLESLNLRITG